MHAPLASDDTAGWEHGSRAIQPLLKAAFPLRLSATDSMADALLRCERANARLRSALAVPPSYLDHAYLRSWVDRVGACDLTDLVRDDALLDTLLPERSSPELALHPFNPWMEPPHTQPMPPPKFQSVHCYAQTFDSPRELLTPR
eukprot:1390628-Pleurochrysis_carterae.AAC.1